MGHSYEMFWIFSIFTNMPGLELTALGSDCGLQDIAMETKPHLEQQQAANLEIKGHSIFEMRVSRLFLIHL